MYGWQPITSDKIPANLKGWLLHVNHLKQALTQPDRPIDLVLLQQQYGMLPIEEAALLQSEQGLIRQINLTAHGCALVYGRTIIPAPTYQAFKQQFDSLGERAIGEILLHNKEQVRRTPLEAGMIAVNSDLYQEASQHQFTAPDFLWGRRSQFYMQDYPLLITEIFIPPLPDYHVTI